MASTGGYVSTALRRGLYTRVVGRRILHFRELPSTMDRAALEAANGAVEGTVVLCDAQASGRGRFRRAWVSEPGNLLLSVVLYPSIGALPFVSVIAGLAVARTIEKETTLDPSLKWPNDVMINGKKICGLLVESALEGDAVKHCIIGIGLNVALDPRGDPEIAGIATSLNIETGRAMDLGRLLGRLLQELDGLYHDLGQGRSPVGEWRSRLETLGRRVTVRWGNDALTGVAEDVDDLGHLVLRLDEGGRRVIPAGEVTLRASDAGSAN